MYSNLTRTWKFIHFLAIPLVYGIIYTNASCYTQYFAFNPHACQKYPFFKFIISIIFYFIASMTFICHTYSMITDPGSLNYSYVQSLKESEKTFCHKCDRYRPLRCHHCSTCGRCVLKMDHHCPWIFNCVGFNNQKFFFLFLAYATIGDFISFIALGFRIFDSSFTEMLIRPKYRINLQSRFLFFEIAKALKDPLWIIMGCCLSLSMTIAIGSLLFRQIYLLSRNMTNVEATIFEINNECPYYAKSYRWFMFKSVLGLNQRWKWFFPIFEPNKYNGGYKFDTPYTRIEIKKKKIKDKDKDKNKNKGKDTDNNNKKETENSNKKHHHRCSCC